MHQPALALALWLELSSPENPFSNTVKVDRFSHLDAFYWVRVEIAILGFAKTLLLFPH